MILLYTHRNHNSRYFFLFFFLFHFFLQKLQSQEKGITCLEHVFRNLIIENRYVAVLQGVSWNSDQSYRKKLFKEFFFKKKKGIFWVVFQFSFVNSRKNDPKIAVWKCPCLSDTPCTLWSAFWCILVFTNISSLANIVN